MRATFLLENLLEKIPFLNNAVSPRPTLPVLSGILVETMGGKIKLSATDLELGVETSMAASVDEEGAAVVPARPLFEILANLNEEKITIEKNEKTITVFGKNTKTRFVGMEEGEFPKIITEKGEEVVVLDENTLQKYVPRVVFASSPDSTRPAFSGVLIRPDKEGVLMVATDSHRLSLNKTRGAKMVKTKNGSNKNQLLVSARVIRVLLSQKIEEDVSVFVLPKNNQIVFSFKDTNLAGRLIDAEFPDFEKIIPDSSSSKTEFDRQEMLRSLRVVSVFARDNANIIKLSVKKDSLTLFAKSPSLGENQVSISAKTMGEENEIAFNCRYLIELLQNLEEQELVFEMQGPLNPGVFKLSKDPSFTHLIMPIRIKEEDL